MITNSILTTSSSFSELFAALGREERLVASELPVWCFKMVTDIVEGLELSIRCVPIRPDNIGVSRSE